MEYGGNTIHVFLSSLAAAVVGVAGGHSSVYDLDQPLILVICILTSAFCCGISVVIISKGYPISAGQLVGIRRIGIGVRILRLLFPTPSYVQPRLPQIPDAVAVGGRARAS